MSKLKNFKDLVDIVEAVPTPSPDVKSVTPPGKLKTTAAAVGAALGTAAKAAYKGLTDPNIGKKTFYDVLGGAVRTGREMGKSAIEAKGRAYEKYLLRLSMPNGWPKVGSPFYLLTMYNGEYDGKVTNAVKTDKNETTYTIIAEPRNPSAPRLAVVVTLNTESLPWYSVKKYIVSNITAQNKYIKNEQESGHLPKLQFNVEKAIYELNSKERPDQDLIPIDSSNAGMKDGDMIKGIGLNSGVEIEGKIISTVDRGGNKFYKVAFLPSATP